MCGFVGYVSSSSKDKGKYISDMLATISYRGPDNQGRYCDDRNRIYLGHNRLSIIDLSQSGKQPMESKNGKYVIVFNGEIYNYLELRSSLIQHGYKFTTQTDTEVVLNLYEKYGVSCLEKLNGMFAFAIWDNKRKTLFIGRDRFGIKPIYFYQKKDFFCFASEIKALFSHPLIKPAINYAGVADYLTFQFCIGKKTMFKDIVKLEPGEYASYKLSTNSLLINKYWDLRYEIDYNSEDYYRQNLLLLLEDSVRLQLRSDVPVGTYLSGGLDSSTVTLLASKLLNNGKLRTFTGYFNEGQKFDERKYAQEVSSQVHALNHQIKIDSQDFIKYISKIIWHLDEPVAGPGSFPQFMVSKYASQKVKVALGGQGGDEIFGGYPRYFIAYLERCLQGAIEESNLEGQHLVTISALTPNLPQLRSYFELIKKYFSSGMFDSPKNRYFTLINRFKDLESYYSNDFLEQVFKYYSPFEEYSEIFDRPKTNSFINRMTYVDLKTLLPALLQVEDRMSMAHSLESRVPLLDHRIVELAAKMPPTIKWPGGKLKYILQETMKTLLPKSVAERKDKQGFPVPLNSWSGNKKFKDFINGEIFGQTAKSRSIYSKKAMMSLTNLGQYDRTFWGALSFELWMQNFIDGKKISKKST